MPKYTVDEAKVMFREDPKGMKAEYTRMRDIAQKRIKRMLESEFRESKAVQSHSYTSWKYKVNPETGKKEKVSFTQYGFQELKNIAPEDLATAFSELSKFVNAKGSTITGQKQIREKTIKTWQDQGLNLNQKNYDKTIRILEEMRRRKIVYGSDRAVELADSMLGLDDQQTNEWLDHLDYLLEHTDELQEIPELQGYSFDEIREMIGD